MNKHYFQSLEKERLVEVATNLHRIREGGIACVSVVEKLVEELQQSDLLHLDETHWYESGKLHWLWVAINTKTAVFHIGSRRKEELSYLVQETALPKEWRNHRQLSPYICLC